MGSIFNDKDNAQRLLKMTTGTLILLNESGTCIDIQIQGQWFMKEEDFIGKNIFQFFPVDVYRLLYPDFRAVLTQKCISSRNYELTQNNKTHYFHCTLQPYDNMILCHYKDMTEDNSKNQEILKKNRDLDEIQKIALLSNWSYDTRSHKMYFKGHTGIFTDIANNTLDAKAFKQYILQEDLNAYKLWTEKILKGDLTDTLHYRINYGNKIHHLRAKCISREKYKDGNIFVEGYVQNITEIQQNRNDINLLTNAVNNATGSIFAADEEGNLVFINRTFQQQHDISNKTAYTELKIYDVNPHFKNKEKWQAYVEEVRQGLRDQSFIIPNPVPLRPEIQAIEAYSHWITEDNGKGTVWTFGRDITEKEKMRLALIEAKEKAETSDRLKSAFLANMSHEIRTPLNAIVGFSRIIAETEDAGERNEYYNIVEENNNRLLKLINEILDISKIEANMVELFVRPISMHGLCEEVKQAFHLRSKEGVQIIYDPSDTSLLAMADNSRVFQVISNMLNNSLKFTPKGEIRYGYRKKNQWIEVYVSDTGNGIPAEKLDKIFERFVKGNESDQGTGLGLSICKTLIEKMGGQIQVASQIGQGTRFTFTLPVAEE